MSDILDESFGATPEPVNLDDLIETHPANTIVPMGTIRNRAAIGAILTSKPEEMVEKYRLMVKEGQEGSEGSHQEVLSFLEEQNKTKSMRHVLNILADKEIPLEHKRRFFDAVQKKGFKEEPAVTLQTNALIAASEGESEKGEAARISLSDTMAEMQEDRERRQKMVNALVLSHPDVSAKSVGEVAESMVLPFGRNIIGAKMAAKMNELEGKETSVWDWTKNLLLPGSTRENIKKKLQSIPLDQRPAYQQQILEAVKTGSAVFPSENYYSQFKEAERLLLSPIQRDEETWLENMMTVFDVFWVGSEVKSFAKGAVGARGKDAAEATLDADAAATYANARRPGSANPGVEDVNFTEVHSAEWELVGETTNPMQIGKPKDRVGYSGANTPLLEGPKPKEADQMKRIQLNAPVKIENPATPYSILEQSNPQQARALHAAVVRSTDDELAEAISGVSREQFIANNTLPQIGTESGSVLTKVNQDIKGAIEGVGGLRYTESEMGQAITNVTDDFRNATNLVINDAMSSFRVDGDRIVIEAHYSAPGGSFLTPEAAQAQTKFALRDYAVKDEDIIIMKREGLDYVPVKLEDVKGVEGDYIVKVKTSHEVNDIDIMKWENLDVKRNFFDRFGFLVSEHGGSVSRVLFDPASMLHPTITRSTSAAIDQAAYFETVLLKPIKELRTTIEKMDKVRRSKVEEYLKEANLNQIKYHPATLAARGFTNEEIDAIKKWKDIWDGHYYLENADAGRTLKNQGYQVFDAVQGTQFFAKPVQKNQNISRVYDPSTDSVITIDKPFGDALYNQNGTLAQFRRPITLNGETVEHMIVRNTPTEYLRAIRDTDRILNYKDGYYTIYYKAPKFIEEAIEFGANGQPTKWAARAVAGTTEEANAFMATMQGQSGGTYRVRGDVRAFNMEDDAFWDMASAKGRIAQRHRGQTLEDASGLQHLGDGSYMAHPMESAVRAAKSIADRTMTRKVIETAKERAIQQYGDLFPKHPITKEPMWPTSKGQISETGQPFGKGIGDSRVSDARTTYEYINYIENGYINSTDDFIKGTMNVIAQSLGKIGMSRGEKVFNAASQVGVTHALKTSVFQSYIALNPLRQIVLQPHQAIRMSAYNPKGFFSGSVHGHAADYLVYKSGLLTNPPKKVLDFVKYVDESGMVSGVDKHSLVRGMQLDLADSASKIKRGVASTYALPQVVGFNAGEKVNMLIHLAATYDKHIRDGVNMANKASRDMAASDARALSLEMNFAGDMPYNQTAPAALLQFMQVPHKALTQYTNRKIPWQVKLRLAMADMLFWGTPATVASAVFGGDVLPDDPEYRELIQNGGEAMVVNKFVEMMTGEESDIDFSGVDPYDMSGFLKLWSAYTEDGMFAVIANSPAGQLWLKDGGRIPNAVRMMGRFMNPFIEENMDDPTFDMVLKEAAKISSGWNNADKARILLAARSTKDKMGHTIDSEISTPEAYAALFGFTTADEKKYYELTQEVFKRNKQYEDDVMKKYKDIVRYVTVETEKDNADLEHITRVSGMLMQAFKDDPIAMDMVAKQWSKDIIGGEASLANKLVKLITKAPNPSELKDMIRNMPGDEAQKEELLERIDAMQNARNTIKELQ